MYPASLQDGPWPLRESDGQFYQRDAPDATYGLVKLVGEQLAQQSSAAVHVFRPFSGFAADQSPDYPFRAFLDRARRRADPFEIWGDGTQVRDWIHVDDIVEAVLTAVDQDVRGPVNLCTGRGTSFNELAEMMTAEVGYRPAFDHRPSAPTGVQYRLGDPALMEQFYTPKISIEEGVSRALAAS
jgi:nucleoside-diphosphate-sugar epimerase